MDEIIKAVVERTSGIIDKKRVEKIYEASGIRFDKYGNILIKSNASDTLNSLIKNLIIEGGVIAKIMLHNLSDEKDLKILESY